MYINVWNNLSGVFQAEVELGKSMKVDFYFSKPESQENDITYLVRVGPQFAYAHNSLLFRLNSEGLMNKFVSLDIKQRSAIATFQRKEI